jgi:2-polyprenyl-3-methyl-5-hydroxy-6-metoxy-1,4-benzoquinol methylase
MTADGDARETPEPAQPDSYANPDVLAFYKALPFNYRDSAEAHAASIRDDRPLKAYPPLFDLIGPGTRVLEVGCGVGWLAMGMAHHLKADVTAIDFNPVVIERAAAVARHMGLDVTFEAADLFRYAPPAAGPFDVAVSMGVLHHTDDCHAAVRRICTDLVRPGGHVVIGLYHEPGRRPFLDHFAAMRAKGADDAALRARYAELHSWLTDETHIESWFRDQVLHPHETQHTLREMAAVLDTVGFRLTATSINRWQPLPADLDSVFAQEAAYADLSRERLAKNQYFPGFFVFAARKDG